MKEAFERMTGMPDAWTNPALMQARNGFIQGWEARAQHDVDATIIQYHEATIKRLEKRIEDLEQPAQEPEYRCCPHDSDCAVHNMPAYPAGQCDCSYSNKFNLPPSAQIHEICLKLIERELDKLTNENFGRTPNDAWANKIVDVYHFFDSNPKAKKLTEIYTSPQQRPWVGLTEAQFLEATRLAENGNYLVAFVRIQEWLKEKNT